MHPRVAMPKANDDPSADYPPHLKHLAPSAADLDMVLEEATGQPVDKGTAQANVRALRDRVDQLTGQHGRLLARRQKGETGLDAMLAELAAELERARALLTGYESQLDKLN